MDKVPAFLNLYTCTASVNCSGGNGLLNEVTERVTDEDVALLNARSIVRGHAQTNINNRFEFAAGTSGEGGCVHAHLFGKSDSMKHIGRIAAGGDGDGDIAGAAEGLNLAGKDALEPMIIGDGGDGGKICGQG